MSVKRVGRGLRQVALRSLSAVKNNRLTFTNGCCQPLFSKGERDSPLGLRFEPRAASVLLPLPNGRRRSCGPRGSSRRVRARLVVPAPRSSLLTARSPRAAQATSMASRSRTWRSCGVVKVGASRMGAPLLRRAAEAVPRVEQLLAPPACARTALVATAAGSRTHGAGRRSASRRWRTSPRRTATTASTNRRRGAHGGTVGASPVARHPSPASHHAAVATSRPLQSAPHLSPPRALPPPLTCNL